MLRRSFLALALVLAPSALLADCVDINADPLGDLLTIAHVNDDRAQQIVDGRPWPSVASLTGVNGIGRGRIRDILNEGLACVGVRAARGERETIAGVADVIDADTFEIAGQKIRLIGIDAPEGEQMCHVDGHNWPCGQVATAAVYDLVGTDLLTCEVYGRDRYNRALAECHQHGGSVNAEIVQTGWALAWYPESGAILGPRYDDVEAQAAAARAGIWRGTFVKPWVWRRDPALR